LAPPAFAPPATRKLHQIAWAKLDNVPEGGTVRNRREPAGTYWEVSDGKSVDFSGLHEETG